MMNGNQQGVCLSACFPRLHFTSSHTGDEATRVCMTTSSISSTGNALVLAALLHHCLKLNRKPLRFHAQLEEQ